MKSTTPDAALGVCMGKTIRSIVFAIAAATIATSAQFALAQSAQAVADETLPSPLLAAMEELQDLRLARPLSRNEALALRPLDQFKECERCPEMIVVPAGRFLMGAEDGEAASTPDEAPQHEVSFAKPFAIGRFTVTMGEWDACVAAGGCSYRPADQGWGAEGSLQSIYSGMMPRTMLPGSPAALADPIVFPAKPSANMSRAPGRQRHIGGGIRSFPHRQIALPEMAN